jgi:phosphoglycolate phosphatase
MTDLTPDCEGCESGRGRPGAESRLGPQVVMFDFDGVLADTCERFTMAMSAAFRDVGRPDLAGREQILTLLDDNWYESLTRAGITLAQRRWIDELFSAGYADGSTAAAFPGIREMVARLTRRHTLVVITSNVTAVVQTFLAAHDLPGIGEVLGADIETSKVRKIARVMAGAGAERRHWYVGDTTGDMAEGRRAGVTTVGVAWGWHGVERLRQASPDFIVDTPAQLADLIERRPPGFER